MFLFVINLLVSLFPAAYAEDIRKGPGLPLQGTDVAVAWDALYWFLIWLSVFFFILVVGGMIYFAIRYRSSKVKKTKYIVDHHGLEAFWTVVPTILLMVIFGWGWHVYKLQVHAPSNAMEIRVVGKQWLWQFQYDDGRMLTNELYVPVNTPIKLVMSAEDVLHSFFIPNFRVKSDVVPGLYTSVWFEAKVPGAHQVFCAEYCGGSHSLMLAKIYALEDKEWLAFQSGKEVQKPGRAGGEPTVTSLVSLDSTTSSASSAAHIEKLTLPEQGKKVTEAKGCTACHAPEGPNKIGPTYKGLWDKEQELADGSKVKVDDNYIRESIMQPQVKVAKGFNPVMPPYQGQLSETELNAVVAYIKSLKD